MRTITLLFATMLALTGACALPVEEPTAVQPAQESGEAGESAKPKKKVTVKIVAKRAKAKPGVLSSGGPLSCVKVTVTNQRKGNLKINPLYFSLTDSGGTKHELSDALGEYEGQIDMSTLAPKEKATGLLCGSGKWTPKVVAMTDELLQEQARAEVSP